MKRLILILIYTMLPTEGWTEGQQPSTVENHLKIQATQTDLQQKEALVISEQAHDGKLVLENDEKKAVTVYDLETPPSFSETTGALTVQSSHFAIDPQSEIYETVYEEQRYLKLHENMSQALRNMVRELQK